MWVVLLEDDFFRAGPVCKGFNLPLPDAKALHTSHVRLVSDESPVSLPKMPNDVTLHHFGCLRAPLSCWEQAGGGELGQSRDLQVHLPARPSVFSCAAKILRYRLAAARQPAMPSFSYRNYARALLLSISRNKINVLNHIVGRSAVLSACGGY